MIRKEDLPRLPKHPCTPECKEREWDCRVRCRMYAEYRAIKDRHEEYGTQEFVRSGVIHEYTEASMRRHRTELKAKTKN